MKFIREQRIFLPTAVENGSAQSKHMIPIHRRDPWDAGDDPGNVEEPGGRDAFLLEVLPMAPDTNYQVRATDSNA